MNTTTDKYDEIVANIRMNDNNKEFDRLLKDFTKKDLEMKDGENFTPLLYACYVNNAYALKALIKKGADVNTTIKDGDNGLHFAAYNNYIDIAKLLLKAGTNINLKGYEKRTPIVLAITEDSFDVFELLFNAGADLTIKNDVNRSGEDYIILKPEKDEKRFKRLISKKKLGRFAKLMRD